MTLFKRSRRPSFLDDQAASAITSEQALQLTRSLTFEGLQVVASFGILAANRLARIKPAELERYFCTEGQHAESR